MTTNTANTRLQSLRDLAFNELLRLEGALERATDMDDQKDLVVAVAAARTRLANVEQRLAARSG